MDFAKAFSYVFDDPDWLKKIAIAALVSIIPFVGLGWMMDLTRRVINRDPRPLPDINIGEQFGLGLRAFVVALGYALPAILLVLPINLIPFIVPSDNPETATNIILVLSLCCGSLALLYGLFVAVVAPAAFGNFVAQNRVGAAFKFNEVFGLVRANPGAYLMTVLGVLIAGFIAGLGAPLCGIGALFTGAYAMAVQGHLYGQAYLAASHNLAYRQ